MKYFKIFFLAAILMLAVSCQKTAEQVNVVDESVQTTLVNPSVLNWELAYRLANYGYENESAAALIEAADILLSIPIVDAEIGRVDTNIVSTEVNPEKVQLSVEKLLEDALEMSCGCDTAVLIRYEMIQKRADMKKSMECTRGAVGGAQVISDIAYHGVEQMYFCDFYAHQVAMVGLVGSGDTDLDLVIYDQNMNVVTCDEGYDFDCLCTWTPAWTGRFYIKVVNRGNVQNSFTMATN